jgi:predicted protein tyrosine phosphatase
MNLTFCSRLEIKRIIPGINHALISITCPNDRVSGLGKSWPAVLRVYVDDISSDLGKDYALFDEDHARQIIEFVFGTRPKHLYVNCDAGLSRSAGVVVALYEIIYGEYIGNRSQCALHNKHVTHTILKYWHGLNQNNRDWLLKSIGVERDGS